MSRSQDWKDENPTHAAAQRQVSEAIRRGELEPPEACPLCETVTRVIAHHADPGKPLDIQWRCHRCHWHLTRQPEAYRENPPPERTRYPPAVSRRRERKPAARGRGRPPGAPNRTKDS